MKSGLDAKPLFLQVDMLMKFPQELQLLHLKTKQKEFSHYGQQFTRNAKYGFDC